jgi:predicted CXXCH cytochrome family protein
MNMLSWPLARLCLAVLLLAGAPAQAAITVTDKVSDVRGTKHNLSAVADGTITSSGKVPVRTIRATGETQVCVFCHTPHAADTAVNGPLWNRSLSSATYTAYDSGSMEASPGAPGGSSKLCLSCHDGTMGIDKVNVLNNASAPPISMLGGRTTMPGGAVPESGFTRNLGTDLSNDHPISFTYDSTVASYDGELRSPDGVLVGNRQSGSTPPKLPLESSQMQCATCHDPHLSDKNKNNGNAKFLRMNRFQVDQPGGGAFSQANDIICLACHSKGEGAWAFSAHAHKDVANELYKPGAAQTREFPSSLDTPANSEPAVWQVACLNCHDTHTAGGTRRLLREGAQSGKPALEQACYQCHTTSAESAVVFSDNTAGAVPNIKSDFALTNRMPLAIDDPVTGKEAHDIAGSFSDTSFGNACSKTAGKCGKDMLESRARLGWQNIARRHAECSDCHNPHRVIKSQNGLPGALSSANTKGVSGTHVHDDPTNKALTAPYTTYTHTNIISGVLRGTFGVEPAYPDTSFHSMPNSFAVKKGDPGSSILTDAGQTYVTREYQICLKCHSNYAYDDDNKYPSPAAVGKRPEFGVGAGLTQKNALLNPEFSATTSYYTNQAKEFQAPSTHAIQVGSDHKGTVAGAVSTSISGDAEHSTNANSNNHRSWHPVMGPTGRTGRVKTGFLAPWNNNSGATVGVQTMMCSDCHGSSSAQGTARPAGNTTHEDGKPWGPHGSTNDFLLRGTYNTASGAGQESSTLCFKCHSSVRYATKDGGGTGFKTDKGDGHGIHADRIDFGIKCNFCHVAVPHGWKNRGLLVNLNDVGAEVGKSPAGWVSYTNNVGYTNGPYYRNAYLRIRSFPSGDSWTESNCNGGSKDGMRTNCEKAP